MQKVLALIGLIAIGFVVVIGMAVGSLFFLSAPQTAEAEAYAAEFLEEYGQEWEIAVLEAHGSEELLETAENLAEVTVFFQTQFGSLQSIDELSCPRWQRNVTPDNGQVFLAACYGQATFSQRRAYLDIIVRKQAGAWKVQRFYLNSMPETREAPAERSV
ncbi:MAG: hypothetical protein AAFR65_04070 [Pseudomonadota bacterium]